MDAGEQDASAVVNVDALWGGEPRWYRVGDMSLGDRGIPQTVVFYALTGAILAWLLPAIGLPWAPHGLLVVALFTAAGFVKPGGLRVHVFLPIAAGHALASKHLHGWAPCRDPEGTWRPEALPLEPDGSQPRFRQLRFEGPGLVVRHRAAKRLRVNPGRLDRLRRRPSTQVLVESPGRGVLQEPRELWVPEGAVLIIREGQS